MHNHRIVRRVFTRWVLLGLVALCLALVLAQGTALAQDPDFDTIDDPLNGNYELYTVDDLVIFRTKPENNNTTSAGLNYTLETGDEAITSQGVMDADYPNCYLASGRQPQQTRVGRFFALPYDVIVTLLPDGMTAGGPDCTAAAGEPNMALHMQSTQDTANTFSTFSLSAANTAVAMADFNRDGFDDLFIMSDAEVLVATAKDVDNRNDGMSFGPATALSSADQGAKFEPVAGDFNGDGFVDVAWIDMQNTVRFATVCPAAVDNTICAGQETLAILLSPQDSGAAGISVATVAAGYGNVQINAALAAGHFASPQRDGLLVLDGEGSDPVLTARWYEFDDDFSVNGGAPIDTYAYEDGLFIANPLMHIYATAAKLDWFGDNEQVVVGADVGITWTCPQGNGADWTCRDSNSWVHVFQFKDDKLTLYTTYEYIETKGNVPLSPYWMIGMAVGHFGPLPESATPADFNLQIATMLNDGTVNIYKFNSTTDFTPTLTYTATLDTGLDLSNLTPDDCVQVWAPDGQYACPLANSWLVAGDLQGRSARLGPPSIARISQHMEPSVILGHPPMHADYILPDESTATMTETVNFSVVPNTYYAQYQTEVQNSNQSSHTDTTSHSYGFAESATEKFKVNPPFIASLSGSFTQAWQQQTTKTTATNNYSYSSQSFDSSTNTGFGDQIWFSEYDFNMYYYPVLGQTVCPNATPNCSPSEEQPLYVSYSGPSSISRNSVSGSRAEWYQPVHEPGQIFSYPLSYAQLQARYEGLLPLSSTTPNGFYTDDSINSEFANWSAGSGTSVTTDSVHTHSFKTSNSLTFGPPKLETLTGNGAQISGSFAYNSSSASAALQVTKTSLGSSTGIGIVKPGSFRQPGLYEYRVQPFIFGQASPPGTVQSIPMTATVQTTGPVQAAFTADPRDSAAGSWWVTSPYAQHIDLALNHPQRWAKTAASNVNVQGKLNCLQAGTSTVNCVTFNDPEPDDLWNSEFYQMRGLFVTVDDATGPQRGTAEVGDEIYLQARVYNYSLRDMDSTSQIHMRFYQQEIDPTTLEPTGASVLIIERSLDPLPGFGSAAMPGTQNWGLGTTSFTATTDMADKYYIFWVLVWAEDENAGLVQELPYHGLSAVPGALTSIGEAPLEETTVIDSNGDPKTTSFSNNVGYLHQAFYIAPQQTASELGAAPPARAGELRVDDLTIARDDSATGTIGLEERLLITANITSIGGATEGATVLFYEGSADSAIAYDMELIPHIRGDSSFPVSIPYRPTTCGRQELVVVAHASASARATGALALDVACPESLFYLPVIVQQDDMNP